MGKYIKESRVVSRPGSPLVVTQLVLTEEGRNAITSGLTGPIPGYREESMMEKVWNSFKELWKKLIYF